MYLYTYTPTPTLYTCKHVCVMYAAQRFRSSRAEKSSEPQLGWGVAGGLDPGVRSPGSGTPSSQLPGDRGYVVTVHCGELLLFEVYSGLRAHQQFQANLVRFQRPFGRAQAWSPAEGPAPHTYHPPLPPENAIPHLKREKDTNSVGNFLLEERFCCVGVLPPPASSLPQ